MRGEIYLARQALDCLITGWQLGGNPVSHLWLDQVGWWSSTEKENPTSESTVPSTTPRCLFLLRLQCDEARYAKDVGEKKREGKTRKRPLEKP